MNKLSKQLAYKILRQYKFDQPPTYKDIQQIIEDRGFTIIPYKKYKNSKSIDECIATLHLEEKIQQNNSFIYLHNSIKLVFINSDLSNEEKRILLCHELGHILDPSLQNSNCNFLKIQNEEFANEFSYHLQNPGFFIRLITSKIIKPALLILYLLIITGIVITFIYSNNSYEEYYITSHGEKYHRSFCISVKNRSTIKKYELAEDAEKDGYKPCALCIGQ